MSKTNFMPSSAWADLKPLEFPNCVHLTERYKCRILQIDECIGESCSFCQDSSGQKQSDDLWRRKMNTVNEGKQKKIAKTFYGGRMPWKDVSEEG